MPKPELNIQDYYNALTGEGPLAYEWTDKPHRLLQDLIGEVVELREERRLLCIKVGVGKRVKLPRFDPSPR